MWMRHYCFSHCGGNPRRPFSASKEAGAPLSLSILVSKNNNAAPKSNLFLKPMIYKDHKILTLARGPRRKIKPDKKLSRASGQTNGQ